MNLLEKALFIAMTKHKDKVDKGGNPYILHPLRLMLKMDTPDEMITALLHDSIEDSDLTIEELKNDGFPDTILTAVEFVTKRIGESYADFINRVKENPLALKVKIYDLEDNMDIKRISLLKDKDIERLKKYRKYWEELKHFSNTKKY